MQLKSDPHIFTGMQRDMSISKQKPESLYDAMNIRFTARDGDTMLSITNEKGTTKLKTTISGVISAKVYVELNGMYLGHCVVNDYVIVFTHIDRPIYTGGDKDDYIYKITPLDDTEVKTVLLYEGNLGFDVNHPIETLGVFENDDIQKVYWTDGLNQPRYIICSQYGIDKIRQNDNTQFDFVATLNLEEEVSIDRIEGSGMFAPGTIQYAFSYYNKYGRQSNIFYTSLIHYISYPDRGASPEDKVANSFKIKVTGLQNQSFDYLRVYSIHRTSYNAVPTVKRVVDIELSNSTVSFIDNGTLGDTMDPTEMLYIGGEDIVAQTITQKDNTLFFGNLELTRPVIPTEYKNSISAVGKDNVTFLSPTEGLQEYSLKKYDTSNDYYQYASSLNWSAPGFKNREHYRLGVQFQYKSGKWSEPVLLGDYTFSGANNPDLVIEDDAVTLKVPKLTVDISTKYGNTYLLDKGYIKVRPLVVFPTLEDRLVLTQGILCPTVFSKANRKNSSPFVQSSWFFRPSLPRGTDCIPNNLDGSNGTYLAHRHLEALAGAKLSNDGNPRLKSIEIQGSMYPIKETSDSNNTIIEPIDTPEDKAFYVDQSIVTMHSPDIEWDTNFDLLNYTDWKLRIVGASIITAISSDIDIQVSTPQNLNTEGFIRNRYNTANPWYAGGALAAGLLWNDCLVAAKPNEDDGTKTNYYMYDSEKVSNNNADGNIKRVNYVVYPWQRSGSINNDENRGDNGTRTAVLKQKKLSNLKFCGRNKFFNYQSGDDFDGTIDITQIQLFNSDQMTLTKIPLKNTTYKNADISYYGNVDTLLSGNTAHILMTEGDSIDYSCSNVAATYAGMGNNNIIPGKIRNNNVLYSGDTPVRMKYKSTRHLVFGFTPNADKSTNILPRVTTVPDDANGDEHSRNYDLGSMFWISDKYEEQISNTVNIKVFENLSAAVRLTSYAYSVENGELLVLLGGGTNDDNSITTPRLVTASTSGNGVLSTVSLATPDDGKYYIGTYYESAKIADEELIFKKKTNGESGELESVTTSEFAASQTLTDGEGNNTITVNPFSIHQQFIPRSATDGENAVTNAHFLLAELYKEDSVNWEDANYPYFGGNTDDATKSNLWFPAGEAVRLTRENTVSVEFTQGDTWYTRYDCLKTYPFTQEDENQIVEIASFLCESRINADGRYDRNRGQSSNLNMSPVNFNLMNMVYSNKDNFFNYRMLDADYYNLNDFSNQITWSKEKQLAADVDLWTNITMANTFDLDGTMGPISALRTWKDTIYCFQNKAISVISFNPRVQIPTSDGVPIEISNSYKLEGKVYLSDTIGCDNKHTIAVTPSGIYFIDPNSKELHNLAGNQLTAVSSSHGFSNWFKNNTLDKVFYDNNRNDLYILNADDCIVYSELLGQFTSFMNYEDTPALFNIGPKFYAFKNNDNKTNLYSLFTGKYNNFFGTEELPDYKDYWIEFVSNQDSAIDKIFSTIDTRVDFKNEQGVLHSEFFDKIQVSNEYQDTTLVPIKAKKKFRVWRVEIPRDRSKPMNRIRNTWAKIKFHKENTNNTKMEMHDLSVQYFI